ncbi:MAG: hypothetical protein AAF170_10455, partial [Bacteroidota bacterium]
LILLLVAFAHAPTSDAQMSESELQTYYTGLLEAEGLTSFIDSDGDVQFTYNDRNLFIEVDDVDTEFFRVVMFNIWPIESQAEEVQVLGAANAVSKELKVVKAYTLDDNVWLACELFLPGPEDLPSVLGRCLSVLDDAVDVFVRER